MKTTVTKKGKRFNVSSNRPEKLITDKHKSKDFDTLPAKDKDELLKAALKKLSLLDDNDRVK